MSLNPQYIPLYNLQQYFVDKTTGGPLANGRVYFYSDENRSIPKTVYELSSTTGTYTYVPLPNPVLLSSVGTPVDVNGNDIVIYAFPFNVITGDVELYYVVVQDSLGHPQLTREAVPSESAGGIPTEEDTGIFNYIPNGQFLAHTNLPSVDNLLVAGSNIIAQGGFSVELADPLFSENELIFLPQQPRENPPNSPRFLAELTAITAIGTEDRKNFRIKWNDVNKFSSNTANTPFTFCFWARGNIDIPISIQVVKFCGTTGSIVAPDTQFTDVINTQGQLYQYQIIFGTNDSLLIDTVNNNDYVAIDIAFPVNIPFTVELTDFVLAASDSVNPLVLTSFPLQTNADMITRGVDGWTDVPTYDGSDLYLPKILTRYGYQYDISQIGRIEASIFTVISPLSIIPLPISNDMPCDGFSYITQDYSTIGIPLARLGQKLIADSPVATVPKFGTGSNYGTAYAFAGLDNQFRLTVNSLGTGVPIAADGGVATGWTFQGMVIYNGSTTGSSSTSYIAYNNVVNTVLQVATFSGLPVDFASIGTIPFTITEFVNDYSFATGAGVITSFAIDDQGILAQQKYWLTILTTAASTLVTGGVGLYYAYADLGTNWYVIWFNTGTETQPVVAAPGGLTSYYIQVNVNPSLTAQDVANVVREVTNNLQLSSILITTSPSGSDLTAGSYWTFSTNPSSLRNFVYWYSIDGIGSPPIIPTATVIEVPLIGSDTEANVFLKTQTLINAYQYNAPDFRGMFLRGLDAAGTWDMDVAQRWSTVTGISGANVGTFEYSQIISHNHVVDYWSGAGTGGNILSGYNTVRNGTIGQLDENTGGSETRPVNVAVNWLIKY